MSTDRDRALEKVRKLLRLSKSDNEHEAAAAMRQAQRLMKIHRLDEDDVSDDLVATWKTRYQGGHGTSPVLTTIISAVNRVFNTVAVLSNYAVGIGGRWPAWCTQVDFYGRGASAKIAVYAAQCMQRQMDRDRQMYFDLQPELMFTNQKRQLSHGFNVVWLDSAWKKLEEIKPDKEALAAAEARMQAKCGEIPDAKVKDVELHLDRNTAKAAMEMGSAFSIAVPVDAEKPILGIGSDSNA